MEINKMKGVLIILIIVWAFDTHAMRCNNELVLEGESINRVLHKCGEPLTNKSNMFNEVTVIKYRQDGMTESLIFKSGRLDSIEHNRID